MAASWTSGAQAPASTGTHWLLDWSDCGCPLELMADARCLGEVCVQAAHVSGMVVVGERFHQFQPWGVTGAVLLAESHLTIHTWPELRFAALDVYVCDHSTANAEKGARLVQELSMALRPGRPTVRCLDRQSLRIQLDERSPTPWSQQPSLALP